MPEEPKDLDYSLQGKTVDTTLQAPDLPYKPKDPKSYHPKIGLIACGGITESHLTAYSKAGYEVVALCDLIEERAKKRQAQFYPKATVTTDYRKVLERDDIEVVDIATHPRERLPLIEAALRAKKHVLSQKPFVLDLAAGKHLADLADEMGVRLAVNQNGRWAPHFSYIHRAAHSGLLGDLIGVHAGVHWDHTWIMGTPFEKIRDVILYDFSIHWFDFLSHLLAGKKVTRVMASRSYAAGQDAKPPMLGQAILEFEGGQASLIFDAALKYGPVDRTYVGGTKGTIWSVADDEGGQRLTLSTAEGHAQPKLEGQWFTDGFHGTMGELLCAIEEGRQPTNNARENLNSLALCFAAIASADTAESKVPFEVTKLPPGSAPGAD